MPRVFVSPITRVGHLRPPANAGEIQAGTQLIVFSRVKSADASHPQSSMRHVTPNWLNVRSIPYYCNIVNMPSWAGGGAAAVSPLSCRSSTSDIAGGSS